MNSAQLYRRVKYVVWYRQYRALISISQFRLALAVYVDAKMSVEEVRVSLNPSVRMGWARTLFNLDNEAVNLKGRLVNLVSRKESFNMIIMGPPGSGKNTVRCSSLLVLIPNPVNYSFIGMIII